MINDIYKAVIMVHTQDIGEGVDAKLTISDVLEKAKFKVLYGMLGIIALTLLVSYGSVALVIELIARNNPSWNTWKRFDDSFRVNPTIYQQDLAASSIPFAQQWFHHHSQEPFEECSDHVCNSNLLASPMDRPITTQSTESTCLLSPLTSLETLVPDSQPVEVQRVLEHMGLHKSVPIRNVLAPFLEEPQPLQELYGLSRSCWASSISGLEELACGVQDATNNWAFEQTNYVRYVIHTAVVLQTLVGYLSRDQVALQEVLAVFKHEQWAAMNHYHGKHNEQEIGSYHSLGMTLQSLVKKDLASLASYFAMDLLYDFQVDAHLVYLDNARVFLARE